MTTLNTAVPDVTITENGLLVPDVSDILAGRLTDMTTALGGGASQSLSSPQGQLAQSDTEIIAQTDDKLLCLFNQINPDYSTGRFQDGIGRIYFMDRISAQGTVVTATCVGRVGTIIPAGSSAIDTAGYIYQSKSDATIPSTGSVDVQFTNTTNGGANMNGDTTFTIYDNINYSAPYPEYVMQWQTATPTMVYFKVSLDASLNPPSDITAQVQNMIIEVFNGEYDGIAKARIGASINSGKYYAPVISISPDTVGILSLEVSLDGTTFSPSVTMGIDQVPTIQASDITVTLT